MYLPSFSSTPTHTRTVLALFVACGVLLALSTYSAHAQTTPEETSAIVEQATTDTTTPSANEGGAESTDTAVTTTEDGLSAEEIANTGGTDTASEDSATIDSGDASAGADLSREDNLNETTVTGADQTTVTNENDATIDTDADVLATTGDNTAVAGDTVSISTGIARSTANILNVVNTNIFNADGLFYFLNVLMGNIALDLRNLFTVLTGGTPDLGAGSSCALESGTCNDATTGLTIENTNTANIATDVTVGASTAANTGVAADGTTRITTGDAYAGANVMNIVNTNVTNANYLLLTMNGFGGGTNDIVFPGADWFYELLRGGSSIPAGSSVTVENDNTANVTTEGTITADTGDNSAEAPVATIDSGDANASTNIVNRINTNIFGDSISLLFRVSDNWAGKVFGLPDGWSWRQSPAGVEIFLDAPLTEASLADTSHPYELTNRNTNVANVDTTFNVFALTGDNMAQAGEEASIETGNAEAGANVLNVVNTNVLGRNWVLAIFNILGDWDGNISFGQPDLWVGARAIVPSKLRPATCFEYEFTVNNFGDAIARDVYLTASYNPLVQHIPDMESALDERLRYHVGRMAPRSSRTFTLPACLTTSVLPGTEIPTTFEVESEETDADTNNNTDFINLIAAGTGGGKLLKGTPETPEADLTIEKKASTKTITASSTVEYTITITNNGPEIHYALLVDTIYDPNNNPLHEERWGLEQIYEDETIVLTYTATFNESTAPGVYTNRARVTGTLSDTTEGEPITSPVATSEVRVLDTIENTLAACEPLLTSYIRYGELNYVDDVRRLQQFLRTNQGATDVPLSGEYDRATYEAVHTFQTKYADEVLTPWGVARSTGFVYFTTQKKINELWCLRDFPLTDEQRAEIEAFKQRVNAAEAQGATLPEAEYELIGMAPAAKPESDTEMLAIAESAPAREEEETPIVAEDQVAAAAEAATQATNLWATIRNGVQSLISKWW